MSSSEWYYLKKHVDIWLSQPEHTQTVISKELGVTSPTVSNWINGNTSVSAIYAAPLAKILGCKPDEISKEWREVVYSSGWKPSSKSWKPPVLVDPNTVVIPQFDVAGKMGLGGKFNLARPDVIHEWKVSRAWIHRHLAKTSYSNIENLCIVTGSGDSMTPTFNDGDPLLVDTGIKTLEHDGIYMFLLGDEGYIKRLQRMHDHVAMISDNQRYQNRKIIPAAENLEIVARVIISWYGMFS